MRKPAPVGPDAGSVARSLPPYDSGDQWPPLELPRPPLLRAGARLPPDERLPEERTAGAGRGAGADCTRGAGALERGGVVCIRGAGDVARTVVRERSGAEVRTCGGGGVGRITVDERSGAEVWMAGAR